MKKNGIFNAVAIIFAIVCTEYLRNLFPVANMSLWLKLIVFPLIAGTLVWVFLKLFHLLKFSR